MYVRSAEGRRRLVEGKGRQSCFFRTLGPLEKHQIRGWRAVSAAGLQGKGWQKRSVFSQTAVCPKVGGSLNRRGVTAACRATAPHSSARARPLLPTPISGFKRLNFEFRVLGFRLSTPISDFKVYVFESDLGYLTLDWLFRFRNVWAIKFDLSLRRPAPRPRPVQTVSRPSTPPRPP